MRIILLILLMGWYSSVNAQYDSFSISISSTEIGTCDFEFYKYSTRSSSLQVFTWDGTSLTPYVPDQVRTYRGKITNHPNYKAFAVWYPDGKLFINASRGEGKNNDIETIEVDLANHSINPLNLPIVDVPLRSNWVIASGYSCTYLDLMDPEKGDGDFDTLVAMWENGVNLLDYASTRDLGISITTDLLVIPTDPSIATKHDIIKPSDYSNEINEIPMFWKTTGGGGGATDRNFCNNPFQGGRASFERSSMPSLHHEFGHVLGMKHHHNQRDAMSGNKLYYGINSVSIARGHLENGSNDCLINPNPSYTDVLHPYIADDYQIADTDVPMAIDVLTNDVDYNNETVSIQSFDSTSQQGATITQVGNELVYTPAQGFVGRDYFSYTGQSGNAEGYFTNTAEVMVDVRSDCTFALHYSFEETNGTQITDSAWQIASHQGSLNDADFSTNSVAGVVGNALSLPAEDAVILPDILDPLDKELSVSFWFKAYELPGEGEKSMLFDTGARGNLRYQGLSIMLDNNGLHFNAQTQSIYDAGAQLDYTTGLVVDQWYHVVLLIDRTSNTLRAFVNGVELTNSESNNIDLNPNSIIKGYPGYNDENDPGKKRASTTMGKEGALKFDNFKHDFNGAIDELKIFTTALSQAQIFDLYSTPSDHSIGAEGCSNLSTSNTEENFDKGIRIYPNPSQGILTINSTSALAIEKVSIFSTLGKLVHVSTPKSKVITVDISHLSAGIYFAVIGSEDQLKSIQKLVLY